MSGIQESEAGVSFIDIPAIAKRNFNWNVFVGGRRNGKTYGILKHLMTEGKRFLYIRRTEKDLTKAVNEGLFNELNEDLGMEYSITYNKQDAYGEIYADKKKTELVGKLYAMSTIRSVRGIDFSMYEEAFFDEFVPEKSAVTRDSDGETCINAFETLMSNRELPPNPKPPLKIWMASNSINLFDPILGALNLVEPLIQMELANLKTRVYPERSLFMYHGTELSIAEAKKKTSLYRMIGTENDIVQNILYGKFQGDYVSLVKTGINLRLYKCIFDIDGKVFVYIHKNDNSWYVSTSKQPTAMSFSSLMPYVIRKRFGLRYQYLKTINQVLYQAAHLIEFMDAILD